MQHPRIDPIRRDIPPRLAIAEARPDFPIIQVQEHRLIIIRQLLLWRPPQNLRAHLSKGPVEIPEFAAS